MKFTLIVATVGREYELERLFDSLRSQIYRDFEVVVVDQNSDGRVHRVVHKYIDSLQIRILKSPMGLSRARNVALGMPLGDVVAIPDDDCWYQPTTLKSVAEMFAQTSELDGITGISVDEQHRPSQGRWADVALAVDMANVWTAATSYTIFLRREVFEKIGKFNETLGVGSGTKWGAGEEVELLIRALKRGFEVRYLPSLEVHHPEPIKEIGPSAYARARKYNRGLGRVLRLAEYRSPFVARMVARPAVGGIVALACINPKLSKYRFIAAFERLRGWMDASSEI